jgi:hypothetical protein
MGGMFSDKVKRLRIKMVRQKICMPRLAIVHWRAIFSHKKCRQIISPRRIHRVNPMQTSKDDPQGEHLIEPDMPIQAAWDQFH